MISYSEMVRKLAKDGKDILSTLTPQKIHVWHMASCIMGEAGELIAGAVTQDGVNMVEELGDLEFYMEGLRDGLLIPYSTVERLMYEVPAESRLFVVDGIMVSACDVFDACKKWIIYEKDVDRQKLLDAMARFEWHMEEFRRAAGITREETLRANMAKLAKRYGADYTYTNAAAQNRADKQ